VLVVPATSPVGEAGQCADSILGSWQRYLYEDVTAWIDQFERWDFSAAPIGGVGMGGYCAQVTALRHPDAFFWSGNISGTSDLNYPGGYEELLGTGRGALDAANWDSVQIIENYPQSREVRVWLSHGSDDPQIVVDEQVQFAEVAVDLGMTVTEQQYSGQRWSAWTEGLTDWLTAVADDTYR
jgi:S-formylglutathione hydrolase FrmB